MSIETTSYSELDADVVAQEQAKLRQLVQEANATLDLKRGVFHDLLLYLSAADVARLQRDLDRYLSARSLEAIRVDPSLADDDVVAGVLSNWRISRNEGGAARGQVTVVLSTPLSVTVGSGAIFTADGRVYTADAAFTAKPESAQVNSSTDRLLRELDDGNWAFIVDVTAEEVGTESLVRKDTLVIPSAKPRSYVTSYATADFTGGLDAETNDQLLDKLEQGFAAKAPSNRINMQGMLRADERFSAVVTSSIVGHGDAEMIRDQHAIWPGSLGGKADWYVRTQERLLRLTLTKTATLLSVDDGVGTWQVEIDRDDAPGFYEVTSIRLPTTETSLAGTLSVTNDVRGLDLTADSNTGDFIPDIDTAEEGAFSRFQTAVIRFADDRTNHTNLAVGATADYEVTLSCQPLIGDIQDFVSGFDVRSYGADVLIKAPVPAFVRLAFTIAKSQRQDVPDVEAIKAALAAEVNRVDFLGRLYASQLHDVIHGFLPDGMSVEAIDMFSRVLAPDLTPTYLRSDEVLIVPDGDGTMVSPRTTAFYLDVEDIHVVVSTSVPAPV